MLDLSQILLQIAMLIAMTVPMQLLGQNVQPSELKMATVIGTATDVNGDPVPEATIEH
jgi:hypothetical protein